MPYLIIHWSSFLLRSAPWVRGTIARHWNLGKVIHVLPQYLFTKCLYRTRCSKFTMVPCTPTQEVVWGCHGAVVNRVVPLESDSPIRNNQPSDRPFRSHNMGRLYKLRWRLREFSFESSWLSILPVKHFIVSVLASLMPHSFQILRWFLLRGEGCNTPCYRLRNYLH
jgi:hypothetical protein